LDRCRFSGAGLLQIILEKFSPEICLAQNLVDLKCLSQKAASLGTQIRHVIWAEHQTKCKSLALGFSQPPPSGITVPSNPKGEKTQQPIKISPEGSPASGLVGAAASTLA